MTHLVIRVLHDRAISAYISNTVIRTERLFPTSRITDKVLELDATYVGAESSEYSPSSNNTYGTLR